MKVEILVDTKTMYHPPVARDGHLYQKVNEYGALYDMPYLYCYDGSSTGYLVNLETGSVWSKQSIFGECNTRWRDVTDLYKVVKV